MDKVRKASEEYFFSAIVSLENFDDAQRFFKIFCTDKETQLIAQRLYVAKLLSENKVYSEIVEKTGASSATVSRVKRAMEIDREYFDKLLGTLNGKL